MATIRHKYSIKKALQRRKKTLEIIVHCTATKEGRNYTVEDVDGWHKQKGWSCIGYHYLIYLDGSIHEGRPVEAVGAHCEGHNAISVGVCYVGGLSECGVACDTRTEAQRRALVTILKELKQKYPNARIYGHNNFAKKACPCFNAKIEYMNL